MNIKIVVTVFLILFVFVFSFIYLNSCGNGNSGIELPEINTKAVEVKVVVEDEGIEVEKVRKVAEAKLRVMAIDYSGRRLVVSRSSEGAIVCKFLMPEGVRGGDFTVNVDPVSNEVLSFEVER